MSAEETAAPPVWGLALPGGEVGGLGHTGPVDGTGVSGAQPSVRAMTAALAAGSVMLTLMALAVSIALGQAMLGGLLAVVLWVGALGLAALVVALTRRRSRARLLAWALVLVTALPLVPLVVSAL